MVTRAREEAVVVTSLDDGTRGLLGDYLRDSDRPPSPPRLLDGHDPWTLRLADGLRRLGVETRTGYPVGTWSVDICVGSGDEARGLFTRVDPAGTDAHIERFRQLRRMGWRVEDAFPSRWDGEPAVAAIELASPRYRSPQ
jgi:hypothetical protein